MTGNAALPTDILVSDVRTVEEDWIDLYGHMNMVRYVALFDELGYVLLDHWGLGESYTRETGRGLFVVDVAVRYRRELRAGTPVAVAMRLLDSDDKRLLSLLELRRTDDGTVAATMEQLSIQVDLGTRKVVPFDAATAERLRSLADVQSVFPLPPGHQRRLHCRAK
ncbi:thioesterase family protein [Azospirillum canadense]|uniref:thioesterase family protein n=1 Tax=Azospirillum canadense TaxID=403962 RepID=UPI00222734D7|nr:thioesterase family protein [Azospirillum canadense]MCW2241748.1 acyl-CoA thioester hydrolase [Azospirillum canadense]